MNHKFKADTVLDRLRLRQRNDKLNATGTQEIDLGDDLPGEIPGKNQDIIGRVFFQDSARHDRDLPSRDQASLFERVVVHDIFDLLRAETAKTDDGGGFGRRAVS